MFEEITFFPVLGRPLILYLGVLTFLFFCVTAGVAISTQKKIKVFPLSYHVWLARFSLFLAALHGFLALMVYF